MKLTLQRKWLTEKSTIGELSVNGAFECFALEDQLRAPGLKVYGKTAIPAGTYEVTYTYSQKFGRNMPLINNVRNYSGVRIHWGNTNKDTLGCPLVGRKRGTDTVLESRAAFAALMEEHLLPAFEREKVFIEIINPHGWDAQFAQKSPTVEPKASRVIPVSPPPQRADAEPLRAGSYTVQVPSSVVSSPFAISPEIATPAHLAPEHSPQTARSQARQSVKTGNSLPTLLSLLNAVCVFYQQNRRLVYALVCACVLALLLAAWQEFKPKRKV